MAFFPESDATTASGEYRNMTMTGSGDHADKQGDDLAAAAIEAAEQVATLLEPFLQILTAVVQAFTAWQLLRQA